ncbi:cation:proton antiporter [Ferrimonas gelatinilytica]|uniref:Cation:proton antiporter n=1 Tax=Ferrimonas gelatinilytica TaxID=1255257 RepID=A0ABP9S6I3_9GAMM
MYIDMVLFGTLLLLFSGIAKRIEQSRLSGPIFFVAAGFLLGPVGLGWFEGDIERSVLKLLADLTLALILFCDAANADRTVLRQHMAIPIRMLLLGLPGAILLGFSFALLTFDALSIWEAAILATILGATDAALGKGVFANPRVPAPVREGLNTESGLNDGLCVPFLLLFIALAGQHSQGHEAAMALQLFAEELGIGALVGVGGAALAAGFLRQCHGQGWLAEHWLKIAAIALALTLFAAAQALHGSGYIAAFCGGLTFGYLARKHARPATEGDEMIGDSLAMLTWFVFGAAVVGPELDLTPEVLLYAVLSLTLVRILPIILSLAGSGLPMPSKLFLGWFGPRGLASVVFTIMVLNSDVPQASLIANVVACTVLLSLILHGVSANPLAHWLAARVGTSSKKTEGP